MRESRGVIAPDSGVHRRSLEVLADRVDYAATDMPTLHARWAHTARCLDLLHINLRRKRKLFAKQDITNLIHQAGVDDPQTAVSSPFDLQVRRTPPQRGRGSDMYSVQHVSMMAVVLQH